jgi:2-dehydro-3-deoxy-D-gluconate 5-dehydrogenase
MNRARFAGRLAVVTGAGSGIGRATAQHLAQEGARVLGVDLSQAGLEATFAETPGGEWRCVNIAHPEAAAALPELAEADILVNAAGILRRHPVLEHPLEDWEATLDVNVRGPRRLCQKFIHGRLARNSPGAIVNVCSIESFTAAPAHAAYTVSKTAMLMLTRAYALELAPHGIRVNAIAPGVTKTGMNVALRNDPERSAALTALIPMGRYGEPREQAAAICFLASDDASYITGSVLPVDGGWLTR